MKELDFSDLKKKKLSDLHLETPGTGHNVSLLTVACEAFQLGYSHADTLAHLQGQYERDRPDYETAPLRAVDHAWKVKGVLSSPDGASTRKAVFDSEKLKSFDLLTAEQVKETSPDSVEDLKPRDIIEKLFKANDLICIEKVNDHTATVVKVSDLPDGLDGFKYLNPSTFLNVEPAKGSKIARNNENVLERRFMVLENDTEPNNENGLSKKEALEIRQRFNGFCLSLSKFIPLVMAVDTGGKSIHYWFDCPDGWTDETRKVFAIACDHGADKRMGILSQKARMPNVSPAPGRRAQELLYFDPASCGAEWDTDGLLESLTRSEESSFWEQLNGMVASTPENLKAMEQMAREAIFILPQIALSGQVTIINASYSTGKTLLTCWLLSQRDREKTKDYRIFYVNADDTFNGSKEKANLMVKYGVHSLIPGQQGFDIQSVQSIMENSIKAKTACKVVIVLDTLKKFVDMMDKKAARQKGNEFRAFVQAGGTVIALAHTNKHKGGDGKSIAEGVGDFISDCDCQYTADRIQSEDTGRTVVFTNTKLRGPNPLKVSFTYDIREGLNWFEKFESIQILENGEAKQRVATTEADNRHKEDLKIIEYLQGRLSKENLSKRALCQDDLGEDKPSRGEREKVLARYSQDGLKFHYWTYAPGATRGEVYSLCRENDISEML